MAETGLRELVGDRTERLTTVGQRGVVLLGLLFLCAAAFVMFLGMASTVDDLERRKRRWLQQKRLQLALEYGLAFSEGRLRERVREDLPLPWGLQDGPAVWEELLGPETVYPPSASPVPSGEVWSLAIDVRPVDGSQNRRVLVRDEDGTVTSQWRRSLSLKDASREELRTFLLETLEPGPGLPAAVDWLERQVVQGDQELTGDTFSVDALEEI